MFLSFSISIIFVRRFTVLNTRMVDQELATLSVLRLPSHFPVGKIVFNQFYDDMLTE